MATVYVLGAGASKAIRNNAPLMDELLPKAIKLFGAAPHQLWENRRAGLPTAKLLSEAVHALQKFINEFYLHRPASYPLRDHEAPRLEDILSQVDLALLESRPLGEQYDLERLRIVRESVVLIICEVMYESLAYDVTDRDLEGDRLLSRFTRFIGDDDCVINLNYDLVFDNALHARISNSGVGFRKVIDYGFSIRDVIEGHSGLRMRFVRYPIEMVKIGTTKVAKVHGSLNWLYCPACKCVDVCQAFKGVHYVIVGSRELTCEECGGKYESTLIVPTLLKAYKSDFLVEIWRAAEERLASADEVVFVGYSLPEADIHFRCMVKRALYANSCARSNWTRIPMPCKIHVVGLRPAPNEVYERYRKLFVDVVYHDGGLAKYVEEREAENRFDVNIRTAGQGSS